MRAKIFIVLCLLFLSSKSFAYLVTIRNINIEGNTFTSTSTIMDYSTIRKGEMIGSGELERRVKSMKKKLEDTYFFSNVETKIELIPPTDDTLNTPFNKGKTEVSSTKKYQADITIKVKDSKQLWAASAGSLFGEIGRRNLTGRGEYIGVKLGTTDKSIILQDNYLFSSPIFIGLSIESTERREKLVKNVLYLDKINQYEDSLGTIARDYKINREGGKLSIGYHITPYLLVSLQGRNQSIKISDPIEEKGFMQDEDKTKIFPYTFANSIVKQKKDLSVIRLQVDWDKRDSQFRTQKGFYLGIYAEVSDKKIKSDFSYEKYLLEMRHYYSFQMFERKQVLSFRHRIGYGDDYVPYFEQFDLVNVDGSRTISSETGFSSIDGLRGYDEHIGTQMILNTAESRILLYELSKSILHSELDGVFFFEMGKTWTSEENIGLSNWMIGWGPGVRLYIIKPIDLVMRLECGFKKSKTKFYFDMTKPF